MVSLWCNKNTSQMKTRAFILRGFTVLCLSIFMFSCSESVEEQIVTPDPDPVPDPVATVSFRTTVKPIIDNNCISCHNGSRSPDLRTYAGIKASASSVSARVANRSMPQGGSLSQEQIDNIVNWVNQGALDN